MSKRSWIGHALGGRYRIEELLGQGGMSAVYKAADPNLRRYVAVKLIHSHLSDDPEFVRRFETEAAAVAQLRHPNIIQVFDFDHEDEHYYMVLEYVPGETLQTRLKRLSEQQRRLAVSEVVKIGTSVSEAADYAHTRGMIHRDIKPANIMLNVQGQAILTDFGVAKMVGQTHFTATGAVLGTALYMSPEQIRGERVDHRCDIYSLGVTLFEMASGRLPFEADSAMTVMMMHLNDPVPDLLELNPNVAPPLKGIIEKALTKNPDNRFQSANELAEALTGIFGGQRPIVRQATGSGIAAPISSGPSTVGPASDREMSSVPAGQGGREPLPASSTPEVHQTGPPATGSAPGTPPAQSGTSRSQPAISARMDTLSDTLAGISPTRLAFLGAVMGIGGLIVLIFGIVVLLRFFFPAGTPAIPATPTEIPTAIVQTPVATEPVVVINPTDTLQPPTPTAASTPLPTSEPTATIPFTPFARIQDVFFGDDRYVVVYETFGFEPAVGDQHIHFFYDTVPEDIAGRPGSGPWVVYGGPPPFRDLRVINRPPDATQVCVRVANPNHTIVLGSGNCFDLPSE